MNRSRIGVALVVGIAWSAPLFAADKDKPPRPLPQQVVAAWKKAGADLYWARPDRFGFTDLYSIEEAKEGDLPTFRFFIWKARVLPKLPQPDRPFGLDLRYPSGEQIPQPLSSPQPDRPSGLDLGYRKVTDAALTELAGLKRLQLLDLSGSKVTDAGLKELMGLKELRTLDLSGTQVTGTGIKELAGLKHLRSLGLSSTRVTDAGIKALAGLESLQALNLNIEHVTEAGLKELARLERLQSLNLDHSRQMTDADLKVLTGLKQLESLDLGDVEVTVAGLRELAGLKHLRFLRLDGIEATDTRLKELIGVTKTRMTGPQCERLIADLVNPGKPPFKKPYVLLLPQGMEGMLRKKQEKIAEAHASLSENIEVSLPLLVKHADDERFSYVYQQPTSGVYKTASVGEACRDIIEAHVEVYHRYVRKYNDLGIPRSLWFLSDCGGIEQWWKDRKGKRLAELQLEGIEWALRQEKPKYFKTEKEWAAAKKSLREMGRAIRVSKSPLMVRHHLYFFGK